MIILIIRNRKITFKHKKKPLNKIKVIKDNRVVYYGELRENSIEKLTLEYRDLIL